VEVDESGGGFALRINGARVFARGTNWTPLDASQPGGDDAAYRRPLTDARDAGMNLLRAPANFPYEADAFYDLCDELGLLVWQDFAFANFDFPIDDPEFAASVRDEVHGQLDRLQAHPSLAVLCGGSEAYQQPAMLGLPRESWHSALFESVLPEEVAALCPAVPYVANSPMGGSAPFRPDTGIANYYGVGAYRRPLEDARRSEVRFAAECLAFANVPARSTLDRLLTEGVNLFQWSEWKRRAAVDAGASWDFDDVRDHYLAALYRVDPVELRSSDFDRYLQLSSATSGEVMEATFAEWRRGRSACRGGLVWQHRDLIDGARFGVTDTRGHPKPAWWFLRRAFRPRAIFLADEGLSGLRVHAFNDGGAPLHGSVELTAFRGAAVVESAARTVTIAPHGEIELESDALIPRFVDITRAYRFGPPAHDLVAATLRDAAGEVLSEAFYFPLGRPCERRGDLGLTARTRPLADGSVELTLATVRHAQSIALEVEPPETRLEDNWFHLRPGAERRLWLRPPAGARLRGYALALNAELPVRFSEAP
jgi:beta-mannosidase